MMALIYTKFKTKKTANYKKCGILRLLTDRSNFSSPNQFEKFSNPNPLNATTVPFTMNTFFTVPSSFRLRLDLVRFAVV